MSGEKKGVPGHILARAFGITNTRVEQLAQQGVILKIKHGEYDPWPSIQGYIAYKNREWEKGKSASIDDPLHRARTRLTEAKAETAEIDAALARGDVIAADIVEALWTDSLVKMKAKVLAMPTRLAPQLEGQSDTKVIHQLLKEACHEALAEVADYDPEPLVAAWNEKRRGSVEKDDEVGESAAGSDGQPVG